MTLACIPYDSDNQALLTRPESNSQAGLAPLLLTVVELVRQLLEAQIIRRMEKGVSVSLIWIELQKVSKNCKNKFSICVKFLRLNLEELNVHLGEFGTLLPEAGSYYPGKEGVKPSVLELVDRLLNTGVVVEGNVDLGLAQLDLIHLKLRLVLTSQPV
jgi:hypothetical protein